MTSELLGELAYTAFCSSQACPRPDGSTPESWRDLDPHKREAWCNIARAIWWRIMGSDLPEAKFILSEDASRECQYCGFIWPPGHGNHRCSGCQQAYEGN